MEEVAAGETDLGLRTIAPVGASDGIALNVEIVGLVEHAVQTYVEGVCIRTGRKLEICRREDTCRGDLTGRLQIVVIVEQLTGTQFHVLEHDPWTDG